MMAALLIYIIKWAVVLTLLYSLYGLFLRRETFHGVNRAVLLCILMASMVLSLITIEIEQPTLMTESVSTTESILSASVDTALKVSDTTKGAAPIQREDMKPVNITIWSLIAIYVIGLVYGWLRYLLPLAAIVLTAFAKPRAIDDLYQIVTEAPGFVPENEKLVLTSVPAPPFSLKETIENEDHHLHGITWGRREMYAEPTDMLRGFNFRHENGETYMQVFGRIDSDEETIWLGGPDTYIVNVMTGIRYKARRALPPADLNCDIVVKGCKGQEFMFTIVFPNLPKGSWNARIYGVPYCQLRGGAGIPDITKYFEN